MYTRKNYALPVVLIAGLVVTGCSGFWDNPLKRSNTIDETNAIGDDVQVTDTTTQPDNMTDSIQEQETISPIAYNDSVINPQIEVVNLYDAYDDIASETSLQTGDFSKLDQIRLQTLADIEKQLQQVTSVGPFKGDDSLRQVIIAYIQGKINLLRNEETELIALWTKWQQSPDDDISNDDVQKEKSILKTIDTTNNALYTELNRVQELFAQRHGYTIRKTERNIDYATLSPIAYNDLLINYQIKAVRGYRDFDILAQSMSIATGDFMKLDTEREVLMHIIERFQKEVVEIQAYQGDASLRDVIDEYLITLIGTLSQEEKELITLWKKWQNSNDSISDADKKREDELIDSIDTKRKDAYEKLHTIQKAFAEKHNFTIN